MKKFLALAAVAAVLGITFALANKLVVNELEEAMNLENDCDEFSEENAAGEAPAQNEKTTAQVSDEI